MVTRLPHGDDQRALDLFLRASGWTASVSSARRMLEEAPHVAIS